MAERYDKGDFIPIERIADEGTKDAVLQARVITIEAKNDIGYLSKQKLELYDRLASLINFDERPLVNIEGIQAFAEEHGKEALDPREAATYMRNQLEELYVEAFVARRDSAVRVVRK